MEEWAGTLREVVLIPGTGGVFDVDVDGNRVFSKRGEGLSSYPSPDEVLPRIRAAIDERST